jgi:integrase
MAKALTAAAVERLRPAERRREIPDGGCAGLYLVIQPSGVKSFALRFRQPSGKTAKLTLGRVDLTNKTIDGELAAGAPLTLAGARMLATRLHHERAHGRDVVAAKHRERAERAARGAKVVGGAMCDFAEQQRRKNRRWEEQARLLGVRQAEAGGLEIIPRSIADRWRDRPLAEINGDDIHSVIDEAREKSVPGFAARRKTSKSSESRALALFAALSKFFGWAVERRRIAANPCAGVARPETLPPRTRALSNDEAAKFWRAAEAERPAVAAALRLLLLTGQRLGEVRGMRRSELSKDGATWTIPPERTKNKRVHILQLPAQAQEIIAAVMPSEGEYVFTNDGSGAIAIGNNVKIRLDERMGIAPWRLHDLRRTMASGLQRLGIPLPVTEKILNHVSGSFAGIVGVYQQHDYAIEKRDALAQWARFVMLVVDDDLRTKHEKFLGAGGDQADETFRAAVSEGGARWDRYLKAIAGDSGEVVTLPRGRARPRS